MKKIKISVVSYSNSLPFVFGLQTKLDKKIFNLSLDMPSVCAEKLLNNEIDIGLIPVATLKKIDNYSIISDFCISANGKVASVLLFSDVPLNEIKNIYLDYQSQSSINLVQILAKEFWKISPNFLPASKNYENSIEGNNAGVVIGDRTFFMKKKYAYVYDLSEEWKKYTGLPFVFAVWTTQKKIANEYLTMFNEALNFGIKNKQKVINENKHLGFDIEFYLNNYIQYHLDKDKEKAISLFLSKI